MDQERLIAQGIKLEKRVHVAEDSAEAARKSAAIAQWEFADWLVENIKGKNGRVGARGSVIEVQRKKGVGYEAMILGRKRMFDSPEQAEGWLKERRPERKLTTGEFARRCNTSTKTLNTLMSIAKAYPPDQRGKYGTYSIWFAHHARLNKLSLADYDKRKQETIRRQNRELRERRLDRLDNLKDHDFADAMQLLDNAVRWIKAANKVLGSIESCSEDDREAAALRQSRIDKEIWDVNDTVNAMKLKEFAA